MSLDVLACIDELVDRITHREPYTTVHGATLVHQWHTTTHPPLLAQLAEAAVQSNATEDGPRPAYASKPAARLEAIDALARIDNEASRWLRRKGEDDPGGTAQCVRSLAPFTADRDLAYDIGRWWSWARIHTGWDTPAWQPANTCPLCGVRGSLRIRLAQQVGTCIDCHETWEPDTIGLLADHIRYENADTPAIVDYVALP